MDIVSDDRPRCKHLVVYPQDNCVECCKEEVARLRAEVAALKTVPMKYRRMEYNARLQEENNRLYEERDRLRAEVARLNTGWESVARREEELSAERDRLRELLRDVPVGSEFRSDWEPWIKKRDAALKEGS